MKLFETLAYEDTKSVAGTWGSKMFEWYEKVNNLPLSSGMENA